MPLMCVAWMIPDEQVCLGPIASCYVFSWSSGSDRFRPVKNWDLPKDCRDACRVYNDDYLTYRQRHQRYDVGGESCSIFSKVQTGTSYDIRFLTAKGCSNLDE